MNFLYSGILPRNAISVAFIATGGPANRGTTAEVDERGHRRSCGYDLGLGRDLLALKIPMSYNISGGEPLLRSDLFEILEEISWKGADIYILSNGTKITRESARKLARNKVSGVQVSIEGPDKIHEYIRGKGSFAGVNLRSEKLLASGIPVTLNATLSTVNAGYFPEMVSLAKSLGVQKLWIFAACTLWAGSSNVRQDDCCD